MALVGHISGSTQSNSLIAVSGTVIVANRPDALFPSSLPGSDVSFFVSGTIGGKGGSSRTVSLFGGDAHVSGSLTIGTGSVKITSNDVQFGSFSNRIELVGNSIKFFDGDNTNGVTLQGLAAAAAGGNDTEVQYNNGGSLAGSSAFTFDSVAGRVTATHIAAGTSLTASIVKAGGMTVSLFDDVATTINFGAAATAVNVGASGGTVTVAGDLQVSGNDIKSSTGATAITLAGASVIIPGDLTVNGTTTTVNTTNLEVKDAVIGLGFDSGSIGQTGGDRGLILGLGSSPHAAFLWKHSESEFAVGSTTSSATGSLPIALTGYSNFHANNIQGNIITASLGFTGSLTKLATGGDYLRAGSGIQLVTGSSGQVTISSTASTNPGGLDTYVQFNDGGSTFGGDAGLTYNKTTDTLTGVTGSFYRVLVSDVGTVNGAVTLGDAAADTVTINGTTTFAGAAVTTTLQGSGSIAGTLNVTGQTTLGIATVNTNLLAVGNVTLGDTSGDSVNISGTTTFFGSGVTTTLQGSGSISGALTVGGNTTLGASSARTVTVNGVTTFAGASVTTTLAGSGSISGALLVAGNSTLGTNSANTVTVNGTTTFAGAAVTTTLAGSGSISGNLSVGGSTTLGNGSDDTVTFNGVIGSNLLPSSDRLYNLGSPSARWNNVYTGDLHLRNERGNWTVIEEETYLSIRNNHTGKMYKFVLEEIVDPVSE